MVCWSLSFIWYKEAYQFFGPMTTIFFRLIISGVLLLFIALLGGKLKIEKKHFILFILAAFFEPFLYFMGESFGMQLVSSVTAAVIVSTIPVFTPIISSFFYEEKLSFVNIAGIVISFTGVSLVIIGKGLKLEASTTGIILMFVAVAAAIGYSIVLKKIIPHYEPITIVAIQNAIGTVMFAPLFFILEWNTFASGFSVIAFIPILKLSIFASSIAFIFYAYGVNAIGVSRANIFTNLIPVLTSIFAFFFLKEHFTSIKITGIFITVTGLFLSQINSSFYGKLHRLFIKK